VKILDTVICQDISKRIKLSTGDKIKGSLEVVHKSEYDYYLYLRIHRLLGKEKHWWGEEERRETVYETPDVAKIGGHWDVLFEVLEDGEYHIEVDSFQCCFKVQLYLERGTEDRTVMY